MVYNMFFFVYLNKLRLIGISTYCFKKFIFVYKVVYVAIIPRVYYVIFIYQKSLPVLFILICAISFVNCERLTSARIIPSILWVLVSINARATHNKPLASEESITHQYVLPFSSFVFLYHTSFLE